MLRNNEFLFYKSNIDVYLKEVAKEYKKLIRKDNEAEIIIVGGAAVLLNYNYRYSTTNIDAYIYASSAIKDAINIVRDRYNLREGWLNSDFVRTSSYSPKIIEYSKHYKTFYNVLRVRTINAEYLVAMKLKSSRLYKNDLSDIIGILLEHKRRKEEITMNMIYKAINDLYGRSHGIPMESLEMIERIINTEELEKMYLDKVSEERRNKEILLVVDKEYTGVIKESNVNDIIKDIKRKIGE